MKTKGVVQEGSSKREAEINTSFVLEKVLKASFEDRPVPTLAPGSTEALIQIKQTGICGSDVHYYSHGSIGKFVVTSPMVLGHESSSVVVAVGSGCKSLKVGDRVALEPGVPCRQCTACKVGVYNICADMAFAATPPFDGTLCKYYKLAEDFCYKLPDDISYEEGALIEPLAVAVHICRQATIIPGSTVVVFGAGPVGLLCAAVAKSFGATTVVSVDLLESRLVIAREYYGATHTYVASRTPATENAAQLIQNAGLGDGADVAIDASGAESSVQTGIHVLRSGGTYVQGGMGKYDINFPIGATIEKELNIRGSFRYGSGDYQLAISLVARKKVNLRRFITGRYQFLDAEQAFKDVRSGMPGLIKVLIEGPVSAGANGVEEDTMVPVTA